MAIFMFEQFIFTDNDTTSLLALRELKGLKVSQPVHTYPYKCGRVYQFIIECSLDQFGDVLEIFENEEMFFRYREVFP